jgi:UDP-glucose:(heptosyl)LPS alpha-1,3-glucosyltransferase
MGRVPITIANDDFNPERGGSERYLATLARWLLASGRSVRLFARRVDGDLPSSLFTLAPCSGKGWLADRSFARALDRHLGPEPGIVLGARPFWALTHYVLTSGLYRRAFDAERESLEEGLRKTLMPLGNKINAKRRWLVNQQESLVYQDRGTQLLVFSEATREDLVRNFNVPPQNITVSLPGVDLARFRPTGRESARSPGQLRLLFIAHNFVLKGLRCLLQALAQARGRGLRASLDVAGGGPQRRFERQAAALGLSASVRFHGSVADNGINRLFRSCDVLVHPTFFDPCSLVALEALACGCPVITTKRSGASNIIVSGRHGFVLDHPRDVDALTAALLAVGDQKRLEEMRGHTIELTPALDFEKHARVVEDWLSREKTLRRLAER